MEAIALLRELAEQHDYRALQRACMELGTGDSSEQVLMALAQARLGNGAAARSTLSALQPETLDIDTRVDVAAVHLALGNPEGAARLLEADRQRAADHPQLLARLAACSEQQGAPGQALALYERSVAVKQSMPVYLRLLQHYRDASRHDELASCLDAATRFWAEVQGRWSEAQQRLYGHQLRVVRLDLWLARDQLETAESWIDKQLEALSEQDWCALLAALSERLAERDQHAQAEACLRRGLETYPDSCDLYAKLAELANVQGRQRQALALLQQAIRLAQAQQLPCAAWWIRLATMALPMRPELAARAVETAGELLEISSDEAPEDGEPRGALSVSLELARAEVATHRQHYSQAGAHYRAVLDAAPNSVGALQGLGHLAMLLGDFDEAITHFERLKALDPARGYSALFSARRFIEEPGALEAVEQLARTPSLEGSVKTGLLFQLAAAWQDLGCYDRAFQLADEANKASRRFLPYQPEAHRQRCARIRHAFPKALFEHRRGCGHPSTLPVFVVGMPRSGTTLVEQIVSGHSRIHGAGELGIVPRIIAGLERWERHCGSGRSYPDCVDDLDPGVCHGIAENVLRELRSYAPDADFIVDKLPHNFESVGLIKLLFPNARIISVRRDPRDIAVSNYFTDYAAKQGGLGFAYDLGWIGEQLADHNLLMHHWMQLFPGQLLEIHYEEVVDQPEQSARRLLDYLGAAWEPAVLDFHKLERPVRTASAYQVRQPLYASSKARWRRYEAHLGPLLAGTNRKIRWQEIQMVTLPEPGWLNRAVDCYRRGDLRGAEERLKRLLHFLPEHAAGRFVLGLIYVRTGHHADGIDLMERAFARCPWKDEWRQDLIRAYELAGRPDAARRLTTANDKATNGNDGEGPEPATLFLTEEA